MTLNDNKDLLQKRVPRRLILRKTKEKTKTNYIKFLLVLSMNTLIK